MLRIDGASLAIGNKTLLDEVSLHIRPGERIGIVGRNGAGKTTLVRALLNDGFEGARVHKRKDARLGFLPQHAVEGSEQSVWDEAATGLVRIRALQERLERTQAELVAGTPEAIAAHDEAEAAFRLAGGYAQDQRIGTVLHGLGFDKERWSTPCNELSGGWQMRVALARLLLSDPDVAFLDEPTNHLDLQARTWLASHLANVPWTVVLISHDRHLLDRVCTRIVEVRHRKLFSWTGNYTRYLAAREEARALAEATRDRQQDEIAHLQKFVDRFGAKATKAKQAKSRAKRIEKIDVIEIEAPPPLPRIQLPEPPASAQRMLRFIDMSVGWDRPLLEGLELELERGMRVAVLGANGCGKSTLLKVAAGELAPLSGRRLPGDRVRLGHFHQDVMTDLDPEATPVDAVTVVAPTMPTSKVRAILGALGLQGGAALRPIGVLSGGERARVALARLIAKPHNLLLLDEPTNHLDAETVEVLVRALKEWTGAMLLVSHDRYVVEQLATHVLDTETGGLREGVREQDFLRTAPTEDQGPAEPKARIDHAERKRLQRERERAERRLQALPSEIEQLEASIASVDHALVDASQDWERASQLGDERAALQARADGLYQEWESLEATIAELEAQTA